MKRTIVTILVLVTIFTAGTFNTRAQSIWTKDVNNPVLVPSGSEVWDGEILAPWVIFNSDSNRYEMWYTGAPPHYGIGFAVSEDGINWSKDSLQWLFPTPDSWDKWAVLAPCVLRENGEYKMWYTGAPNTSNGILLNNIGYATSKDGRVWEKYQLNPVLSPSSDEWQSKGVEYCSVLKIPDGYLMFYGGFSDSIGRIGRALSTDGITWVKDDLNNPVLNIGGLGAWDRTLLLPRVLEIGDKFYLYYTAHNSTGGIWGIGMASSVDSGKSWTKNSSNPILTKGTPGSWDAAYIESGSLLLIGETIHMWYDGGNYLGRVGHATAPAYGPSLSCASLSFEEVVLGELKIDSVWIKNPYSIVLNVTSVISDFPLEFSVTPSSAVIPAHDSAKFQITFHPTNYGIHTGHIILTHDKEYSPLSLDLSGFCPYPSMMLSVDGGWNLLSTPLEPLVCMKESLFCDAISSAFGYESEYVECDTIMSGEGYWLKFSESGFHKISGNYILAETLNVKTGWNLIGSLSTPLPVSFIRCGEGISIMSNIFGYGGSYFITDTIYPGKGYWVKVSGNGTLILSLVPDGNIIQYTRDNLSSEIPPQPPGDVLVGNKKSIPSEFDLMQNYPNPFNPTTEIRFMIRDTRFTSLKIYNVLGHEVATLVNEVKEPGEYSVTWDASQSPSGVYFYRLEAGEYIQTKKLLLLR